MSTEIEKKIEAFKENHKDDQISPPYMYANSTGAIYNRHDLEMMYAFKAYLRASSSTEVELEQSLESYKRADAILQKMYENDNSVKWNYADAPYFTDREIAEKIGMYSEHFHRDGNRHYSNFQRVDPSNYRNKVKEIQELIKSTEDPEEIAKLKDNLISLGWNPEVDYTPEAVEKAKERITAKYNEELHEFTFLTQSGIKDGKYYFFKPICEATSIDLIPVVMTLYEDGLNVIQPYKVPIRDSDAIVDIYVLYTESLISDELRVIAEFSLFILPTNLRAARIAKILYAEANTDISYPNPIIQKLYHGPMNKVNVEQLNEYISKGFTANPIDDPKIVYENAPGWIRHVNYISDNQ